MKSLLILVVTLCFVKSSFGYCYIHPFHAETHCTSPNGVTIPVGSDLQIPDQCEKCSCGAGLDGRSLLMSCCGYGKNAGVFMPPEGCKIVTGDDGCSIKLVQIADETLSC